MAPWTHALCTIHWCHTRARATHSRVCERFYCADQGLPQTFPSWQHQFPLHQFGCGLTSFINLPITTWTMINIKSPHSSGLIHSSHALFVHPPVQNQTYYSRRPWVWPRKSQPSYVAMVSSSTQRVTSSCWFANTLSGHSKQQESRWLHLNSLPIASPTTCRGHSVSARWWRRVRLHMQLQMLR